jgi:hypothetical protein
MRAWYDASPAMRGLLQLWVACWLLTMAATVLFWWWLQ